jgi:hypothetical protein
LPVSRAIVSAKASARWRTTLAKRRSVSIRTATGFAAQAAQLLRAAAISVSASPTGPRHSSAPVAGSKETGSVVRGCS